MQDFHTSVSNIKRGSHVSMLLSRLTQATINSVHTEKKEGDTIAQSKRHHQYKVVIDKFDFPEYFTTLIGAMEFCVKNFYLLKKIL